MGNLPLHPALVHVPLGLAVVIPLLALVVGWMVYRQRAQRSAWWLVIGAQVLLVGAGFAALRTGSAEEERVEEQISETAIETHEERAEMFWWSSVIVLGVTLVGAFVRRDARKAVASTLGVSVLGTILVAAQAFSVGHAGGTLVYEHDAAGIRIAQVGDVTGEPRLDRDEDDEDDHER